MNAYFMYNLFVLLYYNRDIQLRKSYTVEKKRLSYQNKNQSKNLFNKEASKIMYEIKEIIGSIFDVIFFIFIFFLRTPLLSSKLVITFDSPISQY